eukprot:TRINITY_DN822_c0_g2_i2.p1 TRINITY_DN822_c0_g2~~TRINITY_DN822_c0_g2_i2.p1  ORF type:complete len:587 (-),score=143.37 TRINITY_DN822_c0_g2_i2:716-2476(-)
MSDTTDTTEPASVQPSVNPESTAAQNMEVEQEQEPAPFPSLGGIDLGNDTFVLALCTDLDSYPTIVRNDTSDHSSKNLIAFKNFERLVGDSAEGSASFQPRSAVEKITSVLGQRREDIDVSSFTLPLSLKDENGITKIEVRKDNEDVLFLPEQLAAMILVKIQKYFDIHTKNLGHQTRDVFFSVPPNVSREHLKALVDSSAIAKMNVRGFVSSPEALASVYLLKKGSGEETKHVLFADMGTSSFVLSLAKVSVDSVEVVRHVTCPVGAHHFSQAMFNHLLRKKKMPVELRNKISNDPRSKYKVYKEVNKAKVVLSTSQETSIVIAISTEERDWEFRHNVTRTKFEKYCHEDIVRLSQVVSEFKLALNRDLVKVDEIQVVGGGCRIPFVRKILESEFDLSLSYKLDSLDLAIGAAAVGASRTTGYKLKFKSSVVGLDLPSPSELIALGGLASQSLEDAIRFELEMQKKDAEIINKSSLRNSLESLIFNYKNYLDDDEYKDCFPDPEKKTSFSSYLDDLQAWLPSTSYSLSITEWEEKCSELTNTTIQLVPKLKEKLDAIADAKAKAEAEAATIQSSPSAPRTGEVTF